MGVIGRIGAAIWRGLKKAFSTAEHTTNTAVYWIRDSAVESGAQFKIIGHDFFASFRKIDKKKRVPPILYVIEFVSLLVATLYLLRLFDNLPSLRDEMNWSTGLLAVVLTGFMFGQYIFHLMAVFKMSSGLKMAWASMVRTSCNYVILMCITESSLMTLIPLRMVLYPSWILVVVMLAVIVLMFLGSVRDFFTPTYAHQVPLRDWVLYILYRDPFKRQEILEDGQETSDDPRLYL